MAGKIFITGATSGSGKAIAIKFAENGYDIIAAGRREDRLQNLKAELEEQYGVQVTLSIFDISNREEVKEAVDALRRHTDTIDILVNLIVFDLQETT